MFFRKRIKELESANWRNRSNIDVLQGEISYLRSKYSTSITNTNDLKKEIEELKFKIQNPFKFNVLDSVANYRVVAREVKLKAYKNSCSQRLVNLYTLNCVCDNTEITLTEKQLTKLKLK